MHLVVPASLLARLKSSPHLTGERIVTYFYDFEHCVELTRDVIPIAPSIHVAALCKTFLPDLLPPSLGRVMFVDNDVVVVQVRAQDIVRDIAQHILHYITLHNSLSLTHTHTHTHTYTHTRTHAHTHAPVMTVHVLCPHCLFLPR